MDYKRAYGYEKSIYEYYVVGVVAFHGDDVVNVRGIKRNAIN